MAIWVGVAIVGLVVRRPRGSATLLVLLFLALSLLVGTLLGMPPALEYRLPFDPVFILVGLAALAGTQSKRGGAGVGWRRRARSA